MNYFNFRKIAGKGKMSPCSYVNENATNDISSLLRIKRKKTRTSGAAVRLMAQQNQLNLIMGGAMGGMNGIGAMNGMVCMNMNDMGRLGLANELGQGQYSLLQGVGGIGSGGMGMGGMGVNGGGNLSLASSMIGQQMNNKNSQDSPLLRDQRQILAQLQQAHASASSNFQGQGLSQASPSGNMSSFGGKMPQSISLGPIVTDDRGDTYSSLGAKGNWNILASSAPNSGIVNNVNNSVGLVGSFNQGIGSQQNSSINSGRPDNLRAFITQRISLYSPSLGSRPNPSSVAYSQLNNGGGCMQPSLNMGQTQVNRSIGQQSFSNSNSLSDGNMFSNNSSSQGFSFNAFQNNMIPNLSTMENHRQLGQLIQESNGVGGGSFNFNGFGTNHCMD